MNEDGYYEAAYQLGYATTALVMVGLVVWGIVALSRRNRSASPGQRLARNPQAHLALLARCVTLHTAPEHALALVSAVLAAGGRFAPVPAPTPTWLLDGGRPVVALVPTPAGSVLAVREIVVPLPSPEGAMVWEWVLAQVEQAAVRGGVQTSRAEQRFVQTQVIDAYTSIWSAT